jgi:hypothetical protein
MDEDTFSSKEVTKSLFYSWVAATRCKNFQETRIVTSIKTVVVPTERQARWECTITARRIADNWNA